MQSSNYLVFLSKIKFLKWSNNFPESVEKSVLKHKFGLNWREGKFTRKVVRMGNVRSGMVQIPYLFSITLFYGFLGFAAQYPYKLVLLSPCIS